MKAIRKALIAASLGFVGAIGTALLNGSVSWREALIAVGTGLVAGGATYRVPNAAGATTPAPADNGPAE